MTTTTIRPASVQSDGFMRSDHAAYATAWGSYTAGATNNSNATFTSGQRNNAGIYQLFEAPIRFDCASINPAATASSAVIELTKSGNIGQIVYLMAGSAGATVEAADWIAGSALAGATKYGEFDFTGVSNDTPTQFVLNAAGLAAVQAAIAAAGSFSGYIASKLFIDGAAPSADERLSFHASEAPVAAFRPALIVDYATDAEVPVPSVSLAPSGLAPAVLLDSVTGLPLAAVILTGLAPSLQTDLAISVPGAALALAPLGPGSAVDTLNDVAAAPLTLQAFAPLVAATVTISVSTAGLVHTAKGPSLLVDVAVTIAHAGPTLSVRAPGLSIDRLLPIPVGTRTLTAHPPKRAGGLWRASGQAVTWWNGEAEKTTEWTPRSVAPGTWAAVPAET